MAKSAVEEKKTVKVFSLASFLNDMGSDMIYPIWPLFVTVFLGANMAVLGFVDGLGDALVSISQGISGFVSDRIRKRKVFVWTGYFMGSLSRVGYSLSTIWQHLVPLKILDRAGKMRGAPRDAIIADVSSDRTRGRNFGILRMADNSGALVGVVLTVLLFGVLGFRGILLLAAIPSMVGVLLVVVFIKDRKTNHIFRGVSFRDFDRNFVLFLVLSSLFALGYFSYSFFLVFASEAGYGMGFVPVMYLIFTLVSTLAYPFGRLADRIGRKGVLWISYGLFALTSLGFALTQNLLLIAGLFAVYGLQRAAYEPVQRTFVSELAPKQFRASALGAYNMVVGLMALPASVIAGLLWMGVSMQAPFMLSFVLSLLAMVLLPFVRETNK